MSGFKSLRDACSNFQETLQRINSELYASKIRESDEDVFAKKLQDLSLLTSKLRLLRAKDSFHTPQEPLDPATTLYKYGELASRQIIEEYTVKSVAQAHAVDALLTTEDAKLDPQMVERKRKILAQLSEFRLQETKLQQLDNVLTEKEDELYSHKERLHELIGVIRERRQGAKGVEQVDMSNPYYKKLRTLVDKLELMRWLINKLVTPRTSGYDWQQDPNGRHGALKLARPQNTVESFMED